MTSSTPHIFHCIIFSTPRLPKMTLNLFWSLHPNHLFTTLPHLLFSCNFLYSASLSYFHFHFLRIQLYCLPSAFTFELNLVVLLPLSLSTISALLSFLRFHFRIKPCCHTSTFTFSKFNFIVFLPLSLSTY